MESSLAIVGPRGTKDHTDSPGPDREVSISYDLAEPIAEGLFSRKKLVFIENGINALRKTAREQHEVVSSLEGDMKSMISETDLRRAMGLAFQEFEMRLHDDFQDSNRKCLSMFSKRDDVAEIQAQVSKKVNWSEYNTVLRKIADLRQYIDTTAESVFIGHKEALTQEFARKADASMVDLALKSKADFSDMNEVRARLERLEILFSHQDMKQTANLHQVREELTEEMSTQNKRLEGMIVDNKTSVSKLREEQKAFVERLNGAEGQISRLNTTTSELGEGLELVRTRQEDVVLTAITSLQELLGQVTSAQQHTQQDVLELGSSQREFKAATDKKTTELFQRLTTITEQVEFLMQANEMNKRRQKEIKKSHEAQAKEIADAQGLLLEQLSALERIQKKQERDIRVVEGRVNSETRGDAAVCMRSLPPTAPMIPEDPNERLKSVLATLEKIAGDDTPAVDIDLQRPRLPRSGDPPFSARLSDRTDSGLGELPCAPSTPRGIDSARNLGVATSARGGYGGMSPRLPGGAKGLRKKK